VQLFRKYYFRPACAVEHSRVSSDKAAYWLMARFGGAARSWQRRSTHTSIAHEAWSEMSLMGLWCHRVLEHQQLLQAVQILPPTVNKLRFFPSAEFQRYPSTLAPTAGGPLER